MSLKEYRRKRKFEKTPEPRGRESRGKGALRFAVQKHAASRTHYDFRIELDGVLKSWAVPKGPSLSPHEPRLAVRVEDHPIDYGSFEGVIPKGNYGAGTVMLWDFGTYIERSSSGRAESEKALRQGLANGHITIVLQGKKLHGEFAVVKIKKKGAEENLWLLIKKQDEAASRDNITREDRSAATGRTMEAIAAQAVAKGEVWLPGKGRASKKSMTEAKPKPLKAAAPRRKTTTPTREAMPHRIRSMEPVTTPTAPSGSGWLFEKQEGGLRAIAEIERGQAKLYSRALLPFEKKFPDIVRALRSLTHQAVLDGEVVIAGKSHRYLISDVLFLDGVDLRGFSLIERKKRLEGLRLQPPLKIVPSAERLGKVAPSETIVAKRAESRYHSGLTRDWLRFRVGTSKAPSVPSVDRPPLTHLTKVFWAEEGYTKGDLLRYYESIAETILPYLIDRPQSLHRQPGGARDEGFFHKDMTSFLPRRIETERVVSGSSGRTINYVLCQDLWSLLYLVNLGCIELNPWLSRRQHLERPDFVVINLDPDGNPFDEVVEVAREVHSVLKLVGAESFCKTSGATGLHVCVPTGARFSYDETRVFAERVCRVVHQKFPAITSVERNPARRRGRIYLDFLQNRRGQTLAAPYCVRPRPGATVSAPLKWTEVRAGLNPAAFTIQTMAKRLSKVGDLWKDFLNSAVDIEKSMKRLSKRFHIPRS